MVRVGAAALAALRTAAPLIDILPNTCKLQAERALGCTAEGGCAYT